jgi:hypothetical protein
MKSLAALVSLAPVALLVVGCSADVVDDDVASSEAPLTLTPSGCASPNVTTAPKRDAQGRPIAGTAHTTLKGCVVGRAGEDGDSVIDRVTTLLGNNEKLGAVTDQQGSRLFSRFSPVNSPSGSLSSGQTQNVDITLAADHSPKGQIKITRKADDGTYQLSLVNNKPITATALFFTVDVIKVGNLTVDIQVKPESNGVSVRGVSDVQLEQAPEQAEQAGAIVRDMFKWLQKELSR